MSLLVDGARFEDGVLVEIPSAEETARAARSTYILELGHVPVDRTSTAILSPELLRRSGPGVPASKRKQPVDLFCGA